MYFQEVETITRTPIAIVATVQSCYSVNKVAEVSNYKSEESVIFNFIKDYNIGLEKMIKGLSTSTNILRSIK